MGKLDAVSLEIGKTQASIKSLIKRTDEYHKENKDSLRGIKDQLKILNGKVIDHENRISSCEQRAESKWTLKRVSLIIGSGSALFTILTTGLIIFLKLEGIL